MLKFGKEVLIPNSVLAIHKTHKLLMLTRATCILMVNTSYVPIQILVSVSDLKPASNTCTSTHKNTPILRTNATFMLGDVIFSSILQVIQENK